MSGVLDNNTKNDEGEKQIHETGLEITNREIVNPGGAVINTATAENLATTALNSEREATSPDTVSPANDQNYVGKE